MFSISHSYGAYTEKAAWLASKFQQRGFDVVGQDMRPFGQSETKYPGLIDDPSVQVDDSYRFLKALTERDSDAESPLVLYGYSLGATMCMGSYFNLLEKDQELAARVKAIILVCP